jgi:hypothetical protein
MCGGGYAPATRSTLYLFGLRPSLYINWGIAQKNLSTVGRSWTFRTSEGGALEERVTDWQMNWRNPVVGYRTTPVVGLEALA